METADIGLIGLAVMGENLALNFESKGYAVAVYNRRSPGREHAADRFVEGRGRGRRFVGTHSIRELVESVRRPRRILMMIRAGEPVDEMIGQLMPYLEPGDVVIDGGNSDYLDTRRRVAQAEKAGLLFVGCGVSGGELGALHGPSLMPGGSAAAWPLIKEPFQAIAAKLDDGSPCCEWIGPGGSGHFVKTVHNGIEYGDMQLIAETYSLLRNRLGMDNESLASLFESWNRGELNSYLIGITAEIFRFKDDDGAYLLDRIRDVARQKGTGKAHHGQQSLRQLKKDGSALSNIEITDANIGLFRPCAKKYGVDFTLRKDATTQPPHYIVIFKAKDADNMEQAFKEFTAKKLQREERPSIRKDIAASKEKAAARNADRAKEKFKERGLSR